ncbi:1-acyl-sn-glycerol-3-phosphate acyltransferase [Nisaea acidiphila]|uniref:1-acyl-sn-glycerol-3-phosphate acyltransferase n=1 Tax=Nisaea acidiphila TaxID=1862145 RepID=A0A9J7AV57_9PROT|nr:lysophospholipid acyltransferase family protein [Nisaea acidiphila]UUX51215.1 1-acyl-sn-glycerol-3-phosphate acyltransferase [Nisaea acidiphila]
MTAFRATLFNVLFYIFTPIIGLLALPAFLGPRSWVCWVRDAWCRGTLALLALTVGLRWRIEGTEHLPQGPCLVACKHQSAWETIALQLFCPDPAIVLKQELLKLPVVGWYFRKVGMVPIDRSAGAGALKLMVKAAEERAAEGRPVVIFPQGTRVAPGDERAYHPGVYALYRALGLPAVPIALNSGKFWAKDSFIKYPGTIDVRVLAPIPPGLDRKSFMSRLEAAIEEETARLEAAAST